MTSRPLVAVHDAGTAVDEDIKGIGGITGTDDHRPAGHLAMRRDPRDLFQLGIANAAEQRNRSQQHQAFDPTPPIRNTLILKIFVNSWRCTQLIRLFHKGKHHRAAAR